MKHYFKPLNPLKGTSASEKTEDNYGLSRSKSPLGDLGVIFLLLLALTNCVVKNDNKQKEIKSDATIQCAKGFSINYFDNYTEVIVKNPWDTTKILHKYILVDKTKPYPENLPEGTVIKIPVENIACLYSIDASIIQTLGDEHKIKAIAETKYVKIPFLVTGLKEGKIADIGQSTSLNIERLMDVSPDIIIVSPFQGTGYGNLEATGIAIVENAAYMENTPLGRAEWIRFIAAFLQKDKEAEKIMNDIASRYTQLVEKTKTIDFRPTVFCEKKYGQTWWVPGGNSYMAHFLKDAGANYIWRDTPETGSLEFSFETIYDKAENADYWIIHSDNDITYQDLKKEFEPYSYFKAWKEKQIILSNTVKNDYYETGVMNPDWILGDLIHIFHPELGIQERDETFFKIIRE